jgi:osmotically-inducible protein OsmY
MLLRDLTDAGCDAPRTTDAPRIERLVQDRLRRSGYLALRELSCEARDGAVCLRGHVSSYYLKQIAQAAAGDLPGVHSVINLIEVIAPRGTPG